VTSGVGNGDGVPPLSLSPLLTCTTSSSEAGVIRSRRRSGLAELVGIMTGGEQLVIDDLAPEAFLARPGNASRRRARLRQNIRFAHTPAAAWP
jgi:hypothetical protein